MNGAASICDSASASPWAGKRVLLTGASGFVGGHVALQGLAAGVEIHGLGRRPSHAGVIHHSADLTDPEAVSAIVAAVQPEAVIHCAAPGVAYGTMTFADMRAVAEGGTETLYAACARQTAVPRIVHVGSGFEFAESKIPVDEDWPCKPAPQSYGAAKVAAAEVAHRFADRLPIALLRPFHVYGAGEAPRRLGPHLIEQARRNVPVELTGCEQLRDFLHVDDCAASLWQGLSLAGDGEGLSAYNLGTGQAITLRTFIDTVLAELEGNGITGHCLFGALPYREGEPMVSLPDIARWSACCRRPARISLVEGVAELVRVELAR